MCRAFERPPPLPGGSITSNGGRVNAITVNPLNEREVIVAGEFGGLWKTDDGGDHWRHLNELRVVKAVDVAYGSDGQTVIATADRDNRVDNWGGIWRSRDAGETWERPPNASPPAVVRERQGWGISFAPNSLATYVATDYGIAVSADGGTDWNHYRIDQMPINARSVVAVSAETAIVLTDQGVYRTDSLGAQWTRIRQGNYAFMGSYVHNIAMSDDLVFVLEAWGRPIRVYRIRQRSWTSLVSPGRGDESARGPFLAVGRPVIRTADVRPEIELWAGVGAQLKRIVVPSSMFDPHLRLGVGIPPRWTVVSTGLHEDPGHIGFNQHGRPLLYGCDGGLFRPIDGAASVWRGVDIASSGLNSLQIQDLAGTNIPSQSGYRSHVYFATQDNGNWASADGGESWPHGDCREGHFLEVPKDVAESDTITVGYGCAGGGPSAKLSGSLFENPRAVPALDLDGNAINGDLHPAVFMSPGTWLRLETTPRGPTDVWLSTDDGERWARKATIDAEPSGLPVVTGSARDPVVYVAVWDANRNLGLLKLDGMLEPGWGMSSSAVPTFGTASFIMLPQSGSLGEKAMMRGWKPVFSVDPDDADHIICPDIRNEVVREVRGGQWSVNQGLTRSVTQDGQVLLYDGVPHRTEVLTISFDPYRDVSPYRIFRPPRRIFVGTRDLGVFISTDGGGTWLKVPGSEQIMYVTGFFFKRDGTVLVSSYGCGLWEIDCRYTDSTFPVREYMRLPTKWAFRNIQDGAPLMQLNFRAIDAMVFHGGVVTGVELIKGRLKEVSVTPGTRMRRFVPKGAPADRVLVVESDATPVFRSVKGLRLARSMGESVTGLLSDVGSGRLVGAITAGAPFSTLVPPAPRARRIRKPVKTPYVFVRTNGQMAGRPILGEDAILIVRGTGFEGDAPSEAVATLEILGTSISKSATIGRDGTVTLQLRVPREIDHGPYSVRLSQTIGRRNLHAEGAFVKAPLDTE